MTKNNSRSFRFSDETLFQLNSFEGSSLSEKFENIISFCFLKKPTIETAIAKQEQELSRLTGLCSNKRNELSALVELEHYKGLLMLSMGDLMQKLRTFSEKTDREV